jgi:hypothetical protein
MSSVLSVHDQLEPWVVLKRDFQKSQLTGLKKSTQEDAELLRLLVDGIIIRAL